MSRVYQLRLNSSLPPQNTVLTVSEIKKQLISCVAKLLMEDAPFHEFTHTNVLRLVGQEAAPIEISHGGVVIRREDLATNHEEPDNIIVQQEMECAKSNQLNEIVVNSDDTDVFVLLFHCYNTGNLKSRVIMESLIKARTAIDIGLTVEKQARIVPEILAAHALTGCDTVACCFGIEKGTPVKVLNLDVFPYHYLE